MKETSQRKYMASVSKIQKSIDVAKVRLEELDDEYDDLLDIVDEASRKVDKAKLVQKAMVKIDKMELGTVQSKKRKRGSLRKKKKNSSKRKKKTSRK